MRLRRHLHLHLRPYMLALLYLATGTTVGSAAQRLVRGEYRNPSLGYSVTLQPGLTGVTGDQAGPERGIRVSLPTGGTVSVYGEPNSLEWKTPAEGIRGELVNERCARERQEILPIRVGRLKGAKGRLVCGDRAVVILLAFRPGGGPIYFLRLDSTRRGEDRDITILRGSAGTFKLIPWE